jgi:hypothetical protein
MLGWSVERDLLCITENNGIDQSGYFKTFEGARESIPSLAESILGSINISKYGACCDQRGRRVEVEGIQVDISAHNGWEGIRDSVTSVVRVRFLPRQYRQKLL